MGTSNVDVIVFDTMGVIFEEGDNTNNLLIPFIERAFVYTDRPTIHHLYIDASLGHISSKEFWEQVRGDYPAIERALFGYTTHVRSRSATGRRTVKEGVDIHSQSC